MLLLTDGNRTIKVYCPLSLQRLNISGYDVIKAVWLKQGSTSQQKLCANVAAQIVAFSCGKEERTATKNLKADAVQHYHWRAADTGITGSAFGSL